MQISIVGNKNPNFDKLSSEHEQNVKTPYKTKQKGVFLFDYPRDPYLWRRPYCGVHVLWFTKRCIITKRGHGGMNRSLGIRGSMFCKYIHSLAFIAGAVSHKPFVNELCVFDVFRQWHRMMMLGAAV